MKKLSLLLVALLAMLHVNAEITNTQYKQLSDLTNNLFVMAIENDHGFLCTYSFGTNRQNHTWRYVTDVAGSNEYYLFKAEAIPVDGKTYYALHAYNLNEEKYTEGVDGGNALSPWNGGFYLGKCEPDGYGQTGADPKYNALWEIEVSDGGKFAFKSASEGVNFKGKYLGINGAKNADKTYWTCYDKNSFLHESVDMNTDASLKTIEALTNNLFVLSKDGQALYSKGEVSQNVYNKAINEVAADDKPYYFKLQEVKIDKETYYAIRCYNQDKTDYNNIDNQNGINPFNLGYFIGAWDNNIYGSDNKKYNGLWKVEINSEGQFSFQSQSEDAGFNNKYLDLNGNKSETAVYWTCFRADAYSRKSNGEGTFGTLCLPFDAVVKNATVYTVQGVDNNTNPTKLYILEKTEALTAGKAYIFKSTDATALAANRISGKTVNEASSDEALKGTLSDTKAPAGSYIYVGGETNKWKKVIKADTNKVGANRAYLDLTSISVISQAEAASYGARMRSITIGDDDVTGIDSIENESNQDNASYTLGGIRTNDTSKGIRISNNKKYIIK